MTRSLPFVSKPVGAGNPEPGPAGPLPEGAGNLDPGPAGCIGCGYCCSQCVCSVGRNRGLSYLPVPCEFLTWHDGRHWCRVVEEATGESRRLVASNLDIGGGCCSGFNSWRREPLQDRSAASASVAAKRDSPCE